MERMTPVELRNEAEELLKLLPSIFRSSRTRAKSNNLNNRTILFLRAVNGDGLGGLTAVKMVKYAVSDDGKNGQF